MIRLASLLALFVVGVVLLVPARAATEPKPASAAQAPAVEADEIKLSLFGHRRTPNLYWRIDASGKGEIATPQAVGYQTLAPLIIDSVYRIAPGVHRFDIGAAGYAELRDYLRPMIDGKPDRSQMLDSKCVLNAAAHSGTADLHWSRNASSEFSLPHDCLNGAGRFFHGRMVWSWHVLARNLHARGHAAVAIDAQPALRVPMTLGFSKQEIWTGARTRWHIGANGHGWIEFSADGHLPTLDIFQPHFAKAGRRYFRLDGNFHQAILRELDPYLNATQRNDACEKEITTTDQPMVRVAWTDAAGKPASYVSDLGCPSFAARIGRIELAFAELIRNGSLGASRLLSAK